MDEKHYIRARNYSIQLFNYSIIYSSSILLFSPITLLPSSPSPPSSQNITLFKKHSRSHALEAFYFQQIKCPSYFIIVGFFANVKFSYFDCLDHVQTDILILITFACALLVITVGMWCTNQSNLTKQKLYYSTRMSAQINILL